MKLMKISSSCELSSYLPLNQLVWHEECETLRLKRLTKLLEHEALRESIHVAQGAPYIILDGAHRCRAAFYLGFDSIPAHVVPMASEQSVSGWVHVYNTRKFFSCHHWCMGRIGDPLSLFYTMVTCEKKSIRRAIWPRIYFMLIGILRSSWVDLIIDVQRMYLLKDSLWNGFFLHGEL